MPSDLGPPPVARWQTGDGGLRAIAGEVSRGIHLSDWHVGARGERVVVGEAEAARLPVGEGRVTLQPVEERVVRLDPGESRGLPSTGGRLDLHGTPTLVVGIDGSGSIHRDEDAVHLDLTDRTRLRLTVPDGPRETMTVPETAGGLAEAVSAAASAHLVTGPGRSAPALRDVPPAVEVGPETHIPDAVTAAIPDDAPHLTVPPDMQRVLTCAPLAFYLGASVAVEAGASPTLHLPGSREQITMSTTGDRPHRLLERTFWLDCLIRATVGGGPVAAESALLDGLPVDPDELTEASPGERLRVARDLPARRDRFTLPEWHLATYVEPGRDAIAALPYLLDRLTQIYPPSAEPLEPSTFMERSLDDFYRATRPTPSVELVEPSLEQARLHGWLAQETPVEAFKLLGEPPVGRIGSRDKLSDLTVTLVLNDLEMIDERTDVAAAYRRGAPIDLRVTTHRELSRDALARVIEADADLLHFIGHCEPDGLVCPDGTLSAASVSESGAEVAFLNACGSYYEGADLVRRGSAASVVTYRGVLDSQAATVGAAFARVVTRGFSVERAIRLARRQVMMGMDYGVVGDGTHRVAAGLDPVLLDVEGTDDGRYVVTSETFADGRVGATTRVPLAGDTKSRLRGGTAVRRLDRSGLVALLAGVDAPVVYEGTVVWPETLVSRLQEG